MKKVSVEAWARVSFQKPIFPEGRRAGKRDISAGHNQMSNNALYLFKNPSKSSRKDTFAKDKIRIF